MNDEILNIGLRNALAEVKNALADINWSFIITNDGTVITSEENSVDSNMKTAAAFLQSLIEKAGAVGGLDNMLITGEKGLVYVSSLNDMYLVTGLAKNADLVYFRTISGAVFPTILKVLDNVASLAATPTPFKPTAPPIPFEQTKPVPARVIHPELRIDEEEEKEEEKPAEVEEFTEPEPEPEEAEEPTTIELTKPEQTEPVKQLEDLPSQQLIVDRFSGLMVKADQVQLDEDVLQRWCTLLGVRKIEEVDVETFSGKSARCKAKVINDSKLEGRGLIRIPEKTCQSLDVRRGELIRVKPVVPQESE